MFRRAHKPWQCAVRESPFCQEYRREYQKPARRAPFWGFYMIHYEMNPPIHTLNASDCEYEQTPNPTA